MAILRNLATFVFFAVAATFLIVGRAEADAKPTDSPRIVFSATREPGSFCCKNTTCSGPAAQP